MTATGMVRARRILGYLRACVEAEHAAVEALALDAGPTGGEPLLLERGAAPFGGAQTELAPSNRARRWSEARAAAAGADEPGSDESVWVGWPVVRGHRRIGGRRTEVVAGVLIGQADHVLADHDGGKAVLVPRGHSVALSDEALDLLGYPSDERQLLRRDFDRALNRGRGDTFAAAVRFLNARGIVPVAFDPRELGPLDRSQPLSATAVAWVSQAAGSPATQAVIEDLRALAERPDEELEAGLLGLLLAGGGPPGEPPPVEPVPGIAPLDVHQEAAIAASRDRALSVVTAPAGMARTDLIANTVAAALVRGERVLVASANDRALDVVEQRLAAANDFAHPVRAGLDHQRAVAETIERALRCEIDPDRSERYPTWWAVRADVIQPYEALARRRELTWRLEEVTRRRTELESALPEGVTAEGDVAGLTAALGPARARADELAALPSRRPWQLPRVRSARRALDQALAVAFAALDGPVRDLARQRLASGDPAGALELATTVLAVLQTTDVITGLVEQLAALPDEATLDERIKASYPERAVPSAQLHEDRWADLLSAGGRLRSNAQLYRAALTATPPAEHHQRIPDLLGLLPVWLVTTPAAGRWLPLTPGLFDLVVVDDAGQADVASALPVLARGKRAMVIGDPQQLPPVTHVTTDLDAQLAAAHELTDDDHRRWVHRRGSLLSFAVRTAGEAPVFLPTVAGVDPELVELIGGLWYGGRLQARRETTPLLPGPAVRWLDHRGQFDTGRGGRSGRNAGEALVVVDEVMAQLADLQAVAPAPPDADEAPAPNGSGIEVPPVLAPATSLRGQPLRSIGVITPLAAQREALSDLLLERFGRSITVDTPETFQGDERDVVIVSLVIGDDTRRELVELAANDARLGVALSGARSRLVIVGDREVAARSGTRLADVVHRLDHDAGARSRAG